ncbi:Putative Uricase [[Torrubiella] hemipterigena]|uniref:Uricase n=1 Tax=[Torrubiella] hemipterigena TaxID=1531966 RepID=A0A0A1TKZ5_9HYPO|nr:Putative Uricase [[Torrubiella] hemipterigena]
MPSLTSARYGKDNVRVFKTDRDAKTGIHTVTEMTVCCLLEGDIETSYTRANNNVVVATDSMKNTIFIFAKQHPVDPPEQFAAILGDHFIQTYPHIHVANIDVTTHRWNRIALDGKEHPHSFVKDGNETRVTKARISRKDGITIQSGIKGLTVLKSTGSAFHSFVRDEYTTLPETWDRILSTEVDAIWEWKTFATLDAVKSSVSKFGNAWQVARDITLRRFAQENSASVQATMYNMSEDILAAVPDVEHVLYSLPNKHYFELDLKWHKGLKNLGKDATIYVPQTNPNGLITCTVSRSSGRTSRL